MGPGHNEIHLCFHRHHCGGEMTTHRIGGSTVDHLPEEGLMSRPQKEGLQLSDETETNPTGRQAETFMAVPRG